MKKKRGLIPIIGILLGLIVYTVSFSVVQNDTKVSESKKAQDKQLRETLYDDTVLLSNCDEKHCYNGTGFVVASDEQGSWIVTNKHVCLSSSLPLNVVRRFDDVFSMAPIGVTTRRSTQAVAAQIVKLAPNADLCLIRSDLKFKKPLKLAKTIKKGEPVMTFGFPGGKAQFNSGKYITTGGVGMGFYSLTDMKLYFGASGSAVLNSKGEVVGVVSNIRFKPNTLGKSQEDVADSLFIPLDILREFLGGI